MNIPISWGLGTYEPLCMSLQVYGRVVFLKLASVTSFVGSLAPQLPPSCCWGWQVIRIVMLPQWDLMSITMAIQMITQAIPHFFLLNADLSMINKQDDIIIHIGQLNIK